jgi:AAA family ATP:ADP antiporter
MISEPTPKSTKSVTNPLGAAAQAGLLFTNFFLIITALYQLKPASRSLFIEALGTDRLPYVWIATAVILALLITWYQRLVARHTRVYVVLASCGLFVALLVGFRVALAQPSLAKPAAVGFYIFVDIFSVVLVEQFWSLTNTLYSTGQSKRWYGLIGIGGLLGGVTGGALAAALIHYTPVTTVDLTLVAAAILLLLMALTLIMYRLGLYRERPGVAPMATTAAGAIRGWRSLVRARYLLLIAAILLLAQFAQPLVEYQFLKTVEKIYPHRELRTEFLSGFFSALSMVAIVVNLVITPLVLRYLGVVGGLLVQPLVLGVSSVGFMAQPLLLAAEIVKISDRGLSYSINRAARELLYVPIDPVLIYQAKAWIDMFGYRLFKVLGSALILLLTQWLPLGISTTQLSWVVLAVCLTWVATALAAGREYRRLGRLPATQAG